MALGGGRRQRRNFLRTPKKNLRRCEDHPSFASWERSFEGRKFTLMKKAREMEEGCGVVVTVVIHSQGGRVHFFSSKQSIIDKLKSCGLLGSKYCDNTADFPGRRNMSLADIQNFQNKFQHSENASSALAADDETQPADHRTSPQNSIERRHLLRRLQSKPRTSQSINFNQVDETRADTTDVNQPSSSQTVNRQNVTLKNKASTSQPRTVTFNKRINSNNVCSNERKRTPASTASKNNVKNNAPKSHEISQGASRNVSPAVKGRNPTTRSAPPPKVKTQKSQETFSSAQRSSPTTKQTNIKRQESSSDSSSSDDESESDEDSDSESEDSTSSSENSSESSSSDSEEDDDNENKTEVSSEEREDISRQDATSSQQGETLNVQQDSLTNEPATIPIIKDRLNIVDSHVDQEDLVEETRDNLNCFSVSWPPEEFEMDHVPQRSALKPTSITNLATGSNDLFPGKVIHPKPGSMSALSTSSVIEPTPTVTRVSGCSSGKSSTAALIPPARDKNCNFVIVEDLDECNGLGGDFVSDDLPTISCRKPSRFNSRCHSSTENKVPSHNVCEINVPSSQSNKEDVTNVFEVENADPRKNSSTDGGSDPQKIKVLLPRKPFVSKTCNAGPISQNLSSSVPNSDENKFFFDIEKDKKPILFVAETLENTCSISQTLNTNGNSRMQTLKANDHLFKNPANNSSCHQARPREEKGSPSNSRQPAGDKLEDVTSGKNFVRRIKIEFEKSEVDENQSVNLASTKLSFKENKHVANNQKGLSNKSNAERNRERCYRTQAASKRPDNRIQQRNRSTCGTATKNNNTTKRSIQTLADISVSKRRKVQTRQSLSHDSLTPLKERNTRHDQLIFVEGQDQNTAGISPITNRRQTTKNSRGGSGTLLSSQSFNDTNCEKNFKVDTQSPSTYNQKNSIIENSTNSLRFCVRRTYEKAFTSKFLESNLEFKKTIEKYHSEQGHVSAYSILQLHKQFLVAKGSINKRYEDEATKEKFLFDALSSSKMFVVFRSKDNGRTCIVLDNLFAIKHEKPT